MHGGPTSRRRILRRSRGQVVFAPPLRPIGFRFSGFRGLDFLAFSESLGLVWGVPACFYPADPPRSVPGLVCVILPFARGPGHVSEFWAGFWGVPACFCRADPPLSAGAGLGLLPVLSWPRTRFLFFVCLFVCLFFQCSCEFCPADPPRSVPGHDLGNRAALLRHRITCFSC